MLGSEEGYRWPPIPHLPNTDATESMTLNNTATDVVAPRPHKAPRKKSPKLDLKAERRRAKLEANRWALKVTAISVTCRACEKVIKLDRRKGARYYGGNWKKHLKTCDNIKLELSKPEVIDSFVFSDPSRT
jgi:hypothetical protein